MIKPRTGASAAQVPQILHLQPSTALALELCCHMESQRETFGTQLCLKNNWTHLVLPHCSFTVNFTHPSHGHAWPQASCSHPQPELLLLLPSPGHGSQMSNKVSSNSCSRRTCTPAHGTKPSLTLGQRLAALQGPQQLLGCCFGCLGFG